MRRNLIQEPNEVKHIEETPETEVEEDDIELDQQDSKRSDCKKNQNWKFRKWSSRFKGNKGKFKVVKAEDLENYMKISSTFRKWS